MKKFLATSFILIALTALAFLPAASFQQAVSGASQVQGASASGSAATGNPVWVGGWDGTNVVPLKVTAAGGLQPAATTPADATSNTNVPGPQSFGMIFNGTTWDRLRSFGSGGGASGALGIQGWQPAGTLNQLGNPINIGCNNGIGASGNTLQYVNCDASGNLTVTGPGASGAALSGSPVRIAGSDGTNTRNVLVVSAANLGTSGSNTSAILGEKGPRWNITNVSAGGSQGTVSKAAGGVGVRHVVDCISFSANSSAAVTAANVTINVRDGASGAGTAIWSYSVSFPTAAALGVQEVQPHSFCGLNLIGTANTAMTIEFSAAVTGAIQAVNASGYDVQ